MRESRTKRLTRTLKQTQEAAPDVATDVWEFELKESVRTALSAARKRGELNGEEVVSWGTLSELLQRRGVELGEQQLQWLKKRFTRSGADSVHLQKLLRFLGVLPPKDFIDPDALRDPLPQPYRSIMKILDYNILDRAWLEIISKHPEIELGSDGKARRANPTANLSVYCTPESTLRRPVGATAVCHCCDNLILLGFSNGSLTVFDSQRGVVMKTLMAAAEMHSTIVLLCSTQLASEVSQRFRVALYSTVTTAPPLGNTNNNGSTTAQSGSVVVVDFEQQYGEDVMEHKILGVRKCSSRVTAIALSGCGQWLAVQADYREVEIHPLLPASKHEASEEAGAARMEPIEEDNELPDVASDIAAIPPCTFALTSECEEAEGVLSSLPLAMLPDPALHFVPTQPKLTLAYPLPPKPPAVIENIVVIPPLTRRWQVYRLVPSSSSSSSTASTEGTQRTEPRLLKDYSLPAAVSASALRLDKKVVAIGMVDGVIHLYDLVTLLFLQVVAHHTTAVSAMVFYGKDTLLSGSIDGAMSIAAVHDPRYDGSLCPLVATVRAARHDFDGVSALQCFPHLPFALVQSASGLLTVYDIDNGELLGRLSLHASTIRRDEDGGQLCCRGHFTGAYGDEAQAAEGISIGAHFEHVLSNRALFVATERQLVAAFLDNQQPELAHHDDGNSVVTADHTMATTTADSPTSLAVFSAASIAESLVPALKHWSSRYPEISVLEAFERLAPAQRMQSTMKLSDQQTQVSPTPQQDAATSVRTGRAPAGGGSRSRTRSTGTRSTVGSDGPRSARLARGWSRGDSGEYPTMKASLTEENLALHDPTIRWRQSVVEACGFHDPKYLMLETLESRHLYRAAVENRINNLKASVLGQMQTA